MFWGNKKKYIGKTVDKDIIFSILEDSYDTYIPNYLVKEITSIDKAEIYKLNGFYYADDSKGKAHLVLSRYIDLL